MTSPNPFGGPSGPAPFGAPAGTSPAPGGPSGPGAPFGGPPGPAGPADGSAAPGGFPGQHDSGSGTGSAPLVAVGPPTGILLASGLCAVIGIVLGAVFFDQAPSIAGWVAAGPVAIGLLALYSSQDTARSAAPLYLRQDWVRTAYAVVLLLIAVGVILSAVAFAFWMGRQ